MPDHFLTLGAFPFRAREVTLGGVPRQIGVGANALSAEPVQTTDYISGYMVVAISGFLQGVDTQGETAVAHLARLRHNLRTEVAKDSNLLTINWAGLGDLEQYRVFKNDDLALTLTWNVQASYRIDFALTLNCLPA